jgi:2-hydroxymuconate-semialdehyde hydrolase
MAGESVAKPVLVLLHGGGPGVDAAGNWRSVIPRLTERFTCVAPDLLGFGSRIDPTADGDLPRGPAAWARARAEEIRRLLDLREFSRVHLLGNSAAGGAAALALVAAAPERVDRAVVMGGAGTGPLPARVPFYDEPTRESMRATLGRLVADENDHLDLLAELTDIRYERALRPGAEAAFRSMVDPGPASPPPTDPAAVTRPVLALHGERDRVSSPDVSERLVAKLPHGRLEIVTGAGHWIHVDRPDEFCAHVEGFLLP